MSDEIGLIQQIPTHQDQVTVVALHTPDGKFTYTLQVLRFRLSGPDGRPFRQPIQEPQTCGPLDAIHYLTLGIQEVLVKMSAGAAAASGAAPPSLIQVARG